eukprot:5744606-Pleurochrysis_carterae.AAC.1
MVGDARTGAWRVAHPTTRPPARPAAPWPPHPPAARPATASSARSLSSRATHGRRPRWPESCARGGARVVTIDTAVG